MSAPERMHPADLERLAELVAGRVLQELSRTPAARGELVDAGEVARRFGVSVEWVRDHAEQLGVVRLGDGPRPRLRFDPERVTEALKLRDACSASRRSVHTESPVDTEVPRRRRRRAGGSSAQLLPIRGEDT